MDAQTRKALTQALQKHVAAIAKDLREKILAPGPAQDRAKALHADEKVGEAFELWTDLLSRRAAVLWVLKTVYVRVLEDRGLLTPKRLVEPTSWHLFSHLAPNLGHTAYLRWVFRDLATEPGGLPELFSPQPAEVAEPSDTVTRALIDFWQAKDEATGKSTWRFDDENFDGRLMGDLYQDLDPVVRERFALLQTPDFVLDFILDRTLTPAIEEFGIETVRVLDPACGSGHFLIAALKRLATGMFAKFPDRPRGDVAQHCLERIVGIDLNDYACALARARLVMTALELSGERDLSAATGFHPKVFWADGLDQLEREQQKQTDMFVAAKPTAVLTRPEVRVRLRPELEKKFHVVVGNPPYITEKDPSRREYHREKVGKERRYVSASGKYSLGAPFSERMFQLATPNGFVGQITANSFMKREFGAALIEKVLPREDLFLVVDTSGAFIPGHGTPTVLLFGRHRSPSTDTVPVVMGKRGEPGTPADAARGKVWSSIVAGWNQPDYESEFVSVSDVPRESLNQHPWSIGGGGAAELKEQLEAKRGRLSQLSEAIGITSVTGEDDAYAHPDGRAFRYRGVEATRPLVLGEQLRDWAAARTLNSLWLYDTDFRLRPADELPNALRYLWAFKALLSKRRRFGTPMLKRGLRWYEWQELYPEKLKTPLSIAFAEVATHNHFVLDRGGKVFKQTAPVIKLPAGASEAEHLALLGLLNSSTGLFWLRQVSHCKGYSATADGGRMTSAPWDDFYQFNGAKLEAFPIARTRDEEVEAYASAADSLARERLDNSPASAIRRYAATGSEALRNALEARRAADLEKLFRLVALQEELDWYVYTLYGLVPDVGHRPPEQLTPLVPGQRPFEITLAQEDAERRAAIARGEEPDEAPTEWFSRHGWEPVTSLDDVAAEHRAIIEKRLQLTKESRFLSLIEQPTYKHRWYRPDYEAEEKAALEEFLCDRMEAFAEKRKAPFTLKQMVAALQSDPEVFAVAELLANGPLDLEALLVQHLSAQSVPNIKFHVFKPSGLEKRAQWEKTWELQHREDKGEKVTPPVPPKYTSADFLRGEYWSHRGALDVPKERFIAFTEVPRGEHDELRYGWAGWTHLDRAQHLVELDTLAQEAGVPKDERVAMIYGLQFLLPYVGWESKDAEEEFRSIVSAFTGGKGVTEEMITRWAEAHPPPTARKAKARKGRAA